MKTLVTLVVLAAAPPADPAADRELAWAMAFSTYVGLNCAEWEQDRAAFGSVFPQTPALGPRWDEGGDLTLAVRAGGAAVERAAAADPAFCEEPWRGQGRRAVLLRSVLRPRTTP